MAAVLVLSALCHTPIHACDAHGMAPAAHHDDDGHAAPDMDGLVCAGHVWLPAPAMAAAWLKTSAAILVVRSAHVLAGIDPAPKPRPPDRLST
jgi:hypothetical protein